MCDVLSRLSSAQGLCFDWMPRLKGGGLYYQTKLNIVHKLDCFGVYNQQINIVVYIIDGPTESLGISPPLP